MIIDSHTHNYTEGGKTYSAKDLLASMDEAGIDYSLLLADSSVGGSTTETIIDTCERNPRLKAIGAVEYRNIGDNQIKKLVGYLQEGKIYGLKLLPGYENFYPADEKLFPLYEQCQSLGKPVIFHTGLLQSGFSGLLKQSHPLNIDEVANKFPDLKIVMAHFGNPWVIDAAAVAEKNKNVYIDISGYFWIYQPIPKEDVDSFVQDIKYFRDLVGDYKKVLFGTDWPLYSQKEYLEAAQQLPLTDEEKELVFWKNAKELFGLVI